MLAFAQLLLYYAYLRLKHAREAREELDNECVKLLDQPDSLILMRELMRLGVRNKGLLIDMGVRFVTIRDFYSKEIKNFHDIGQDHAFMRRFKELRAQQLKEKRERMKADIEAETVARLNARVDLDECAKSVTDYYYNRADVSKTNDSISW